MAWGMLKVILYSYMAAKVVAIQISTDNEPSFNFFQNDSTLQETGSTSSRHSLYDIKFRGAVVPHDGYIAHDTVMRE